MSSPTLLVAVDVSTHADEICAVAADLAQRMQARVVLLHILKLSTWVPASTRVESPHTGELLTARELLERDARTHLAPRIAQFQAVGIEPQLCLRDGEVTTQLWDCAREAGATMVVIGSDVPTGLRRLIPLSFTADVLGVAECPVLVVKTRGDRPAPGLTPAQGQVIAEADG